MSELSNLKPGDKVAIDSSYSHAHPNYRVGVIDRINPSSIVLKNGQRFDKGGIEMGKKSGSFRRDKLELLTPDIQALIDKKLELEWLHVMDNKWEGIPDEARKEVIAVLRKHKLIGE